ncbi:MAG TPA: penicillin-binding protein 1C [Candidatus Binataceae bacterium]|nr:penicillin-binding protein 1C [Candidatus Binataceae bacterium]
MRSCTWIVGLAGLSTIAVAALWIATAPPAMPSFAEVRSRWRPSDAQLLDRHGYPLYEMRIDSHGRRLAWISLSEISPALIQAVIASEDRRFSSHHGVDLEALAGAVLHRALGRRRRGASTITMQLAALVEPSLSPAGRRRSIVQKLSQIRAAMALERRWGKEQILEAYLNLVTWRGEVQGVSAASRVLFNKAPSGLTASEAVVIAALVRAPNAHRNAVERRARALGLQMTPDVPSPNDLAAAVGQIFTPNHRRFERVALAPHVALLLLAPSHPSVRSTLDADVQRFAVETLRRHIAEVYERGVDDGAVLVVDNATAEVIAYVGSSGDISGAPWVDSVRAWRQPGSALKPFLYSLALDRHLLTAASLLEDTPLELVEERGVYRPMDYDHRFRGLVSLRTALGSSLNIPAVRTVDLLGVETFASNLRDLGMNSVIEPGDFYGAALALGSSDVTLWDLVNAYRTLANGGIFSPLRLTSGPPTGVELQRRIYSAGTAFLISNILADRASRSATFGLENSLATRYWSAVKTGTSKDMRDNWCLGYTNRFTVGVWVGNSTGAPMRDVTGITGAAPVWLDLMNHLHELYGGSAPVPPPGVVARRVAFPDSVEVPRTEWFIAGTEPNSSIATLDESAPRIVSPADGSIVALDPDIPADQQRVNFEAGRGSKSTRWVLDGRERCDAASACLWRPTPGLHTLVLAGKAGRVFDQVTFKVRGVPPALQ